MATTINDILNDIRLKATTEREKGTDFERLMKLWFLTDPRYNELEKVWLWEEFPGRKDFGGKDLGIDLVARTEYGDYWAIQCKCYAEDAQIDKGAVDSFLANASRTFADPDTFQTKEFSNLIWVQTTRKRWGPNAEAAIQGLSKPFNRISLYDLEISVVDWDKLKKGHSGDKAQLPGKQPKPHQLKAMSKAYDYFATQGYDRGKLIMACGTGKTYTALKIMEQMTPKDGFVVFLVPSIALLGQTLNAWMADKTEDLRAVCVCSDAKVTREMKDADDEDASVVDLAVPATTDTYKILRQLKKYDKEQNRTVIFSTYQSIDVVKEAIDLYKRDVDLIICDEAHRTTGAILKDKAESNFTKVHNNDFIKANKRLYMTATPRLYSANVKVKAKENENIDVLCSMDDENIYGAEFHRLSFNDAVSQGLLADYKVLVLTVSEEDIPETIRTNIKEKYNRAKEKERLSELNFDDATKLIGCINGLSKRIKGDDGVTKEQDPMIMRRAVAFCQTINPSKRNPSFASTNLAHYFGQISQEYKSTLREDEYKEVVNVKARHIDGSMDANTRNELVAWLKQEADDPNECRVLCNVRCLSEGVDVPALDAVLFLSPRNSEVEVVQSVGRVMRTFQGKKYGYIIIPVIVPNDVKPEEALNDNERFKVVWDILNALRSHDENFNAHVNQINLNKKRPPKITVGGVPRGQYTIGQGGPKDRAVNLSNEDVARQLDLQFGELQNGIYARLVEKVGDKMYWENWGKSIGDIAQKFMDRIELLINENPNAHKYFEDFLAGLHKNINDSISEDEAVGMLAQHMITRPVFDALFKDYQFVNNNAVSRSMQDMIEVLESEGLEMETQVLDKFYVSVKNNVSNIDNLEGKQTIIKNLYEKFFKGAFPKTVEKLGIVYTPVECVDFIIHSVEDILQSEFNTSLTNKNVHILDPFTGTGTFITRLLQSGLIKKEDMLRKYKNEIHCNEIVLLAYYIADVNIESVFHDIMKPEEYQNYDGICLTDTFQLNEHGDNDIFSQLFPENSERLKKQKNAPVRVIIGNPPYSVGQKSANDNAQNLKYEHLDGRVSDTYSKFSTATSKISLYDSYVKAFRWASDRLQSIKEGGVVGFVTNSGWIDKKAFDGFRKCLSEEFSSIYVLNLKGAIRGKSGEAARREGQNIFDIMTGVAVTILVKNPYKTGCKIIYAEVPDYLKRVDKLDMLVKSKSILSPTLNSIEITPNKEYDWVNQREGGFEKLIPLGVKEDKTNKQGKIFNAIHSGGLKTQRDVWCYNYSFKATASNMERMIAFYNTQRKDFIGSGKGNIADFVCKDETLINWTDGLLKDAQNNKSCQFETSKILNAIYRPFCKQNLYYDSQLNERQGFAIKAFPIGGLDNCAICVSGMSSRLDKTSVFITNLIIDLNCLDSGTQCFPLYWYEENKNQQRSLFDEQTGDNYIRRDGITDWILKEVRGRYHASNITKEMIFYYVYGLLHSEDYRQRFAADLKKSLPRIPIVEKVEDFMEFYQAGKKLADLHLNYETVAPYPGVVVRGDRKVTYESKRDPATGGFIEDTTNSDDYDYFHIWDKMRFKSKDDKSTIIYNGNITIENIPQKAYEYIVNGKSAIEWIVERYCVSQDKKSLIKNDCNDWGKEHHKPRYILDLLLSVINVSVQTVDIVKALPKLRFD